MVSCVSDITYLQGTPHTHSHTHTHTVSLLTQTVAHCNGYRLLAGFQTNAQCHSQTNLISLVFCQHKIVLYKCCSQNICVILKNLSVLNLCTNVFIDKNCFSSDLKLLCGMCVTRATKLSVM